MRNLKERLTSKQAAYFRLAVWVALIVWMTFFLAFSMIASWTLLQVVGVAAGSWMGILAAIWAIFTALLVVYGIARWSNRRLRGKGEEEVGGE